MALNEMPSNDEASAMYDVMASAADAGFSVPEPTNVGGGGTVLLGVSANRMDAGDDDMRWPGLLNICNYILECQCVCWFSPFCLSCILRSTGLNMGLKGNGACDRCIAFRRCATKVMPREKGFFR